MEHIRSQPVVWFALPLSKWNQQTLKEVEAISDSTAELGCGGGPASWLATRRTRDQNGDRVYVPQCGWQRRKTKRAALIQVGLVSVAEFNFMDE